VQEVTTLNDVAQEMPQIYVDVDNEQENHGASMVEVEGIITQ